MAACDCDCDCHALVPLEPPPQYALLFHLLLSYLLVAYVRWHNIGVHRLETPQATAEDKHVQTPSQQQDAPETPSPTEESTINAPATVQTDGNEAHTPVSTDATVAMGATGPTIHVDEEDAHVAELRRTNAKYLTMLRVGMPRSVVEHKMRMEGADTSVLDLLLGSAPPKSGRHQPMMAMTSFIMRPPPIIIPPAPPAEVISMAESLSGKYAAFKQMVKVGVPRHVVEHKMRSEGLDPAGLDRDHSSAAAPSSPRSVSSAASTAPSSPDSASANANALLPATFQQASLARAVIRKMQSTMRKKLHWTTTALVDAPPTSQRRDSLWNRVHARSKSNRVSISTETIQWMEKLFVKAVIAGKKARSQRRRRTASTASQSELSLDALAACAADDAQLSDDELDQISEVALETETKKDPATAFLTRKVYMTLLDRNKSQNIAIVLARVKRTFPELVREIGVLNPDVLSISALQTLLDMWPDSNEQAALDAFSGDVSSLATAEQFLLEAQKLPQVQQKLRCLRFKADFTPRVQELRESMELVVRGVSQVISSDAFALVLEYIYHLGNLLNFGDGVEYTSKVKSISISSLSKLSFTKAYDGRVSFLQYLVQSIERDAPHLAHFGDEIDLIRKCSRVSIPNALAELSALKAGVRMIANESKQPMPHALAALPEDNPSRRAFQASALTLHGDAMTLGQEINALGELSDQLDRQRRRFLDYFEEDAALPLDELLGFIATFAAEYSHERAQLRHRSVSHQTGASARSSSNSNSITSRPYMVEVIKRHSL